MRQWRLIYDSPTFGAMNMARDEAILEAVSTGEQPPTLRLYSWQPACLSLGYGQRSSDVDFERAAALGWDVVRRPTGGRAILHTDELTYSLVLPADDPIAAGSVMDSYRRISAALVEGLRLLGMQPEADKRSEGGTIGPVCFETPSHYEITLDGHKLIGSAQLRRKNGVLQHGSLPLTGDIARICDGLVYADEAEREAAKAQVRLRATTLNGVDWASAAGALEQGFNAVFYTDFQPAGLSVSETTRAETLAYSTYLNDMWTRRR